jgi:hypothetical protein
MLLWPRRAHCVRVLLLAIVHQTTPTFAESADGCEQPVLTLPETATLLRIDQVDLEQLANRGDIPARRIGEIWRFNCRSVMTWLSGDRTPGVTAASPNSAQSLTTEDMAAVTGAGSAANQNEVQAQSAGSTADPAFDGERIGEAPDDSPSAGDVLLRDERVLVNPRDVSLNFGQFYSANDSLAFASSDEGNALSAFEQEALITTFQARFGISDETEMFVATSYAHQNTDLMFGNQKLASSGSSEFGDVLLGFRHTLMREGVGRPNIIGSLTTHIPTGDSSYAISGGLGFVKSFDPLALFASANYTRTFSEDFLDVTRLEPEHSLNTSLGFAFALNDTHSLSGSVSSAFTGATQFPNATLRQRDGHSLGFGLTSRIAETVYLEPAVSFALGGTADGYALGVSVFTFRR